MTKHYFTHSFGIDSSGDTSNLPAVADLSIVVEGVFLSTFPQASPVGPASFAMKGLRRVHGTTGASGTDAIFFFNQSATEVVNIHFPVRGRTNDGEDISFTLGVSAESSSATGQVTVWGYYTDED